MATRKIIGESTAVLSLLKLIGKVAGSKTNLLVIGESGTGKELVARMIHETGPLKDKPFIPVNCGAIPETLIESEMFGHKRGSFTGAISEKMGLFEAAHGGTLFLDEVGELPLSMQVKLLRAIQERSFRKVGGNDDIRVDVRIIAATNRDLEAAVAKGTFREDLYYRLNVILIRTPPLREREGDIRLLAEQFLKRCATRFKRCPSRFDEEALAALESHEWPGNIRELENLVERAVTLSTGDSITLDQLPQGVQDAALRARGLPTHPARRSTDVAATAAAAQAQGALVLPAADFSKGPLPLDEILADAERSYLLAALAHAGGVKKKAAELLGITFRSIRYRLSKLGMEKDDASEE
ncbi:MAG: sigma-54 dependent transcriptional regulator [Oligoflexia bacterium]|nr:sigma-54 dependent transcriptional regulator [Oligoflexia bacterium]